MALEIAFYKVTEDIAIRSGLIAERYRTADNEHWILDNKDLSRVRFTADEYINGLSGVEKITENEAETLIALGGYKFGYEGLDDGNVVVDEQEGETPLEQEQEVATIEDENGNIVDEHVVNNEETQENGDKQEETISPEDTGNVEEVLVGGYDESENEVNVEQENEEE